MLAGCSETGGVRPFNPVLVTPATVAVPPGGTVQFAASAPAGTVQTFTWRVAEAGGGSIDADGLYTAPASAGTFHVQVRQMNHGAILGQGSATVTVAAAGGPAILALDSVQAGVPQVATLHGAAPGSTYRWSIQGGAFLGGEAHPDTVMVPFIASAPGSVTLTCAVNGTISAPAVTKVVAATAALPAQAEILVEPWATAGTGGWVAEVDNPDASLTYQWQIQGGSLDASTGRRVTFTAGDGPQVTLVCTTTDPATHAAVAGRAGVAVAPAPGTPVIHANASAAAGSSQVAWVEGRPGESYQWTLVGGAFAPTGDTAAGPTVAFTAGAAGTATLTCVAVNRAGTASPAARTPITLLDATGRPEIATEAWVTAGLGGYAAQVANPHAGADYHWSIQGGSLDASSGRRVTFTAGAGPALTLTVADPSAGARSISVAVAPPPEVPEVQAPEQAVEGSTQGAYVQGRAGETYRWDLQGSAVFLGGDPEPAGTRVAFTAASAGPVLVRCRAINQAGDESDPGFREVTFTVPAGQPVLEAPGPVAAGSGGHPARVVGARADLTYTWFIHGGTFEGSNVGPNVTYRAGSGPAVVLACTARTASGSVSAPASTGVAVTTAPAPIHIHAAAQALAGSTQAAWVEPDPAGGARQTYAWTITGGAFGNGASTASTREVSYTAGPAGTVVLTCATTLDGLTATAAPFTQTVMDPPAPGAAPAMPALQVDPYVTAGRTGNAQVLAPVAGLSYTWTVQGNAVAGSFQGTQVAFPADSGSQLLTLACVARDGAGAASAPATAQVMVVGLPPVPLISVDPTAVAGRGPVTAEVGAPLADMTYLWEITGGTFAGGASTAQGTQVSLAGDTPGQRVLTVRARNLAGLAGPADTRTVTLVAAGTVPVVAVARYWTAGQAGLTATATLAAAGTLRWDIQNGTFADGSTQAAGTSVALDTAAPGARLLLCRVVNADGSLGEPAEGVVSVVPAPDIQRFADVSGHPLYLNQTATLVADFVGVRAVVDPGVGEISNGQPFQVGPLAPGATYTLTVRNAANAEQTQALPLAVQGQTTTITRFSALGGGVVDYGQAATLSWDLLGIPTELELDQPGNPDDQFPVSVLGEASFEVVPAGRQRFTLTVQDPLGSHTAATVLAARGVTLLAGDAADSTTGFRDGSTASAAWREVTGVAADNQGNVWFAEGSDHTLRRIAPNGQVSVLAGLRGNPDDGTATSVAGRLFEPRGLALDRDGRTVLVADSGSHTLKAVAPDGTVTVRAGERWVAGGDASHLDSPAAVAADPASGFAFVSEPDAGRLRLVSPQGAIGDVPMPVPPAGQLGLGQPGALAYDPATRVLYVTDLQYGMVWAFTWTGSLSGAPQWQSRPVAGPFAGPRGLAVLKDGTTTALLVADTGHNAISQVDPASGAVTFLAGGGTGGNADSESGNGTLSHPAALAVGGDGWIYVADQGETALRRLSPGGLRLRTLGLGNNGQPSSGSANGLGAAARFFLPGGVVCDAGGNAYVADTFNNTIRMISPQGQVTTLAGSAGQLGDANGPAAAARFRAPSGMAIDSSGNLFVSEPGMNRIRRIDTNGTVSTWAAGLDLPRGLAAKPDGTLFVADQGTGQVLGFQADGTPFAAPVAVGIDAYALALDSHGVLYAVDKEHVAFYRITPPAAAGGAYTTELLLSANRGALDTPGAPEFNDPIGLAVDRDGKLLVADQGNGLVRRLDPDTLACTTVAGTYPTLDFLPGRLPGTLPGIQALAVNPDGDVVVTGRNAVFMITAP